MTLGWKVHVRKKEVLGQPVTQGRTTGGTGRSSGDTCLKTLAFLIYKKSRSMGGLQDACEEAYKT